MAVPFQQTAFAAGEIAPSLFGHVDLSKFKIAAATARNMYVGYRGGLYSRAGTKFVGRAKQNYPGDPPRLIKFQFSITQGYALEFGHQYMRVYSNGAPVVEAPFSITAVGLGGPVALAVPGNNYQNGDWIFISQVGGTTQLNNNTYIVYSAGDIFGINDLNGNPVDGAAFNPYTNGGITERVFTLATPYAVADLPLLKFTQSADVMSLTHPSYPPYDLARISATNWTLTQVSFAANIAAPAVVFAQATTQPSSGTSPPTLPAGYAYVVTAIDAVTGQESVASPVAGVTNSVDIAVTAGSIIVMWSSVAGAGSYNIYKAPTSYNTNPTLTSDQQTQLAAALQAMWGITSPTLPSGSATDALPVPAGAPFGYIGTSFGTQFVDSNIVPDFQQPPPQHRNPFAQGQITIATIITPGAGFTFATVTANSATGSGFIGEAVIVGGGVVAIIVKDGGQNFASGDTLTIAGDGAGAAASPTVGPQTGTYPGCVAYFQQRRVYAASYNNPDTYWMSQPGAFLNFDASIPVTDADAVTGTPWAQQVNGVQAMVPMPSGLVVLTGLGAWQVTGAGGSSINPVAITPSNQQAQPQAFNGCHQHVMPITVNFDILYVQAKGSIVRDLNYNFFLNVYTGVDLTQLSGHLFNGFQINDWAWCEEPYKIVWAVRDDGALLSLTYLKEQEVYGWTRHDTYGSFESVCSVTEPPVDALYLVVLRFPNDGGAGRYYIERMDDRLWTSVEDCWCVDSGLTLDLPAPDAQLLVNGISGLVNFVSSVSMFVPGHIGYVIRAAGGIAVITQYLDPNRVNGQLVKPINQPLTDIDGSPTFPVIVQPGGWTLAPQVTQISGLSHLAGLTVTGLADGIPIPPTVVSVAGTIALARAASAVTVGLAFQPQFQSVYAEPGASPTVQGQRKDIVAATARIEASAGLKAGTNQIDGSTTFPPSLAVPWTKMTTVKDQGGTYTAPSGGTVTQLFTGDERVNLFASWRKPGQVALQQDNPLPMNLLSLIPEGLEGDIPEQGYAQQQQGPPQGQPARGPGMWMLGR